MQLDDRPYHKPSVVTTWLEWLIDTIADATLEETQNIQIEDITLDLPAWYCDGNVMEDTTKWSTLDSLLLRLSTKSRGLLQVTVNMERLLFGPNWKPLEPVMTREEFELMLPEMVRKGILHVQEIIKYKNIY